MNPQNGRSKPKEAIVVPNPKSNLLSEIQGGFKLNPVGERKITFTAKVETDKTADMAEALRNFLAQRLLRTQGSVSSEEEATQDSDNEDWD